MTDQAHVHLYRIHVCQPTLESMSTIIMSIAVLSDKTRTSDWRG